MSERGSDTGPSTVPTPIHIDADDEATWKVLDRIVGERQTSRRAGREYCVRWRGGLHADEWVSANDEAWHDGSTGDALVTWLAFVASQRPAVLNEAARRAADAPPPRRKRVW